MDKIEFEAIFRNAKQGDAYAQYFLGNCYYNSEGVEADYPETVKWYLKAAKQGHSTA